MTYTLLTLLYTVVNIPYCALGGVITDNPTQRISLQSWRFVLATAGGMLSTVLMMPLVNFIGGEDKALGFQGGIAVLSVIAFLMLAFCFFTTKSVSKRRRAVPRCVKTCAISGAMTSGGWSACSPSSISSRSAFAAAR